MWKFKLRIPNNDKEGSKIEMKDYITEQMACEYICNYCNDYLQ